MSESRKDYDVTAEQLKIPWEENTDSDELLLENILKEFSSDANRDAFTDGTAELDVADAEPIPEVVHEPELWQEPVQELEENPIISLQREFEDNSAPKSRRRKKREVAEEGKQQVKVVSENDTNPLFGDDFAKYFGPEAGLATQIEIGEYNLDDEDDFEEPVKKGFFRRRKSQAEEVFYDDDDVEVTVPPEEYIDPEVASKNLIQEMGLIRLRLLISVVFVVPLLYMMVAPKFGLFLPQFITYVYSPSTYLFVGCILQVIIMLLCIETVATGVRDLILFRPNVESIVALSSILTLAHSISIVLFPQWEGYYPYTAISSLSLIFAAYYRQRYRMALLRSYKAVSAMSKPSVVVHEKETYGGAGAVVKVKTDSIKDFVNRTENNDIVKKSWAYASPLLIVLSAVSASIASFGAGQPHRFLWIFSAMITVAAPFSCCVPYYLSFSRVARYLGTMGEAIAGWSAATEFGAADNIIVTDTDLFPLGSITLNGLKVFGGYAVDRVISYSASLISVSGAGTARPFMELLHDQSSTLYNVTNFKYYENGGIGGEINGDSVIVGCDSFMLRTGIKIPKDINIKNAIYIAINLELAGIFAVNYNMQNGVKKAVLNLQKSGVTPVLAIRDFNITPAMIEAKLKISSDTADFPPIEERIDLSNPDRIFAAGPSAVVSREGLGHYADSVICARNLHKSTKISLVLTFAQIAVALLVMFYLMYTHSPVQATPANLLAYMGIWLIPNLIVSSWVNL